MMQGDLLLPQGSGRQSGKIVRRHQERLAIVYIRQSTVQQVEHTGNRPGCNTGWSIGRFSMAGRARRSW